MDRQDPAATAVDVEPRATRSHKGRFVCLLGLLVAAAALSTPLLTRLSYVFDVFSHFTLHYFIFAVACIFGYFMPRARILTVLVLTAAGIGLIAWWPQYSSARPVQVAALEPGERQLRVMTFNTWLRNDDWEAVRDEIARHDPDIVILNEFGREKLKAFTALKSAYPHSTHCIAKPYCHMALLSKVPISEVSHQAIWRGPAYIRARLGKAYDRIYIYGLHSTRPPHIRSQVKQMRAMAHHLNKLNGRKIVMGDFNSTPYADLLRSFSSDTGLNRITNLPTWPARFGPFPQLAIDHVFLSPGMRKISRPRIGKNVGSDHYPAIVDVAISRQP